MRWEAPSLHIHNNDGFFFSMPVLVISSDNNKILTITVFSYFQVIFLERKISENFSFSFLGLL